MTYARRTCRSQGVIARPSTPRDRSVVDIRAPSREARRPPVLPRRRGKRATARTPSRLPSDRWVRGSRRPTNVAAHRAHQREAGPALSCALLRGSRLARTTRCSVLRRAAAAWSATSRPPVHARVQPHAIWSGGARSVRGSAATAATPAQSPTLRREVPTVNPTTYAAPYSFRGGLAPAVSTRAQAVATKWNDRAVTRARCSSTATGDQRGGAVAMASRFAGARRGVEILPRRRGARRAQRAGLRAGRRTNHPTLTGTSGRGRRSTRIHARCASLAGSTRSARAFHRRRRPLRVAASRCPGLLWRRARVIWISIRRSVMVGDRWRDIDVRACRRSRPCSSRNYRSAGPARFDVNFVSGRSPPTGILVTQPPPGNPT